MEHKSINSHIEQEKPDFSCLNLLPTLIIHGMEHMHDFKLFDFTYLSIQSWYNT